MKDYEFGSMNWDADIEMILQSFVQDFSEILEGTDYYVVRNGTVGEKCVNIMKKGESNRVGHVWPKRKMQVVDFCLMTDLIQKISSMMELPALQDPNKERLKQWRCFPRISYDKAIEMISAIAGKNL